MIVPYPAWPTWLQMLVMVPNALLAGYACWMWWPKSKREWNRFGWAGGPGLDLETWDSRNFFQPAWDRAG
jgi:hypothetical protein